jgi:RES domain-containing protein
LLEQLRPRPFDAVVHRIYDPQYGFLETIGSHRAGGRWNRQGQYGALYTSLEIETAMGELRRQAAKNNRLPSELGPRAHVAIRVKLSRVLDLTDPAFCGARGTTVPELLANNELCLQIADEARRLGCEGLLVPSATSSGTNLVVYQDLLAEGWKIEEISRETDLQLD